MKLRAALCLIVLLPLTVYAQHFSLKPERPTVENIINIQYDPSSVFESHADISCIVYFTGLEQEGTRRREFPKAREIKLKKQDELWVGQVDSIPHNATALVVSFRDSIGKRDTNQGKGYWAPLYRHDKPIPGAWAGIGDLLYGEWITEKCFFHVGQNLDSLRQFLLKDIVEYPDIKRSYMRQYLGTFKLNSENSEEVFRQELQSFEKFTNLFEWEWLLLKNHYTRLGDTIQANRCQNEILLRYPQSAWAVQSKTIKLLMNVGTNRDFARQKEMYKEFSDEYLKAYSDEFATRTMNSRAGQMLGYMAEHFVRDGTLELWMEEVDKLQIHARYRAYVGASRELVRLSEQGNQSHDKTSPTEYMVFQGDLNQPAVLLQAAEGFAARAVSLYKDSFNVPVKRFNEPLYFTDNQIKDLRNEILSGYLAVWGKSLLKQNRLDAAVNALAEAVGRNEYAEATINQTYIETLVKAGKHEIALTEMRKVIAQGKSTLVIDNIYKELDSKDLASLKRKSSDVQKRRVKSMVLREAIDDLTFYDGDNRRHSISGHKGKIIILSFWASWCPPCKESLRVLDNTIDRYKNETDIIFLLMNEDANKERAKKWIQSYKNQDAFVFDDDRDAVKKVGINGVPSLVIIDQRGNIRFRSTGMSSYNIQENVTDLEAMIEYLREY